MLPIGPFAVSQAWIAGTKLEAKVLADPDTGELKDDPGPYFTPLEGYSRIGKRRATLIFPDPRQYALNVFTEMLSSIIVPGSFVTPELNGVYDMGPNEAWVNVGRDHDTSVFAVASLRRWWNEMGKRRYPEASELYITADAGGSNGYRSRAWKHGLQKFADETGVRIHVSHFPPGTSKWNKIEHRLFCHIPQDWRGKPPRTFETIVNLIGRTANRRRPSGQGQTG